MSRANERTGIAQPERRRNRRNVPPIAPETPAVIEAPHLHRAPRPVSRTMAEAGIVCSGCAHPFGRHDADHGCIATIPALAVPEQPERCGCRATPD